MNNIINENFSNSKVQFYSIDKRRNTPENTNSNYFNKNQINYSIMDKTTDDISKSFSIAERQVTNKAKNILRTNFLSRYKNSPYIKN